MPERRHIRLTWVSSAESVVAEMLDDEAPQVCELIWQLLPVEHKSIHGQFSGAEVFVLLDKPQPAPPENLCQLPLPGELLYFFDPGGNVTSGTRPTCDCKPPGMGIKWIEIGRHPEPLDEVHDRLSHEQRTARVPVSVTDDIDQLKDSSREQIENDHQEQAGIESPERNTNVLFRARPDFVGRNLA